MMWSQAEVNGYRWIGSGFVRSTVLRSCSERVAKDREAGAGWNVLADGFARNSWIDDNGSVISSGRMFYDGSRL